MTTKPEGPVQRQLDAYNRRDLDRFVAEYADDVKVFRPPAPDPVLIGKAALAAHYAANRFSLPNLHAELVGRLVMGNKVVDQEKIAGVGPEIIEALAVYEVIEDRIRSIWFFSDK